MQPTIVITAPVPGMICVNGRFIGEASDEAPLCAPVSPFGPVYVEYRPLAAGHMPRAVKCVFSGGEALPGALAEARGVKAVAWPGRITEMAFYTYARSAEHFPIGDMPCVMEYDEGARLRIGRLTVELPPEAAPPRPVHAACPLLLGDIRGGGQYMVSFSPGYAAHTGTVIADSIEADGDAFRAAVFFKDTAGHGRLERWTADGMGLRRISAESIWAAGVPKIPSTPQDTLIAAAEAAMLGLWEEAQGYFAPAAQSGILRDIADACDLCVPMKYAPPEGRPCVGLMRVVNERFARVTPLYYDIAPGTETPWRIEGLSRE